MRRRRRQEGPVSVPAHIPNEEQAQRDAPTPTPTHGSDASFCRASFSSSVAVGLRGHEKLYFEAFVASFGDSIPFGEPAALIGDYLEASSRAAIMAPLDRTSPGAARKALREGLAFSVLSVGALVSGACVTNPDPHSFLTLMANAKLQQALELDAFCVSADSRSREGEAASDGGGGERGKREEEEEELTPAGQLCVSLLLEATCHYLTGRVELWQECLRHATEAFLEAWRAWRLAQGGGGGGTGFGGGIGRGTGKGKEKGTPKLRVLLATLTQFQTLAAARQTNRAVALMPRVVAGGAAAAVAAGHAGQDATASGIAAAAAIQGKTPRHADFPQQAFRQNAAWQRGDTPNSPLAAAAAMAAAPLAATAVEYPAAAIAAASPLAAAAKALAPRGHGSEAEAAAEVSSPLGIRSALNFISLMAGRRFGGAGAPITTAAAGAAGVGGNGKPESSHGAGGTAAAAAAAGTAAAAMSGSAGAAAAARDDCALPLASVHHAHQLADWCVTHSLQQWQRAGLLLIMQSLRMRDILVTLLATANPSQGQQGPQLPGDLDIEVEGAARAARLRSVIDGFNAVMPLLRRCPGILAFFPAVPWAFASLARCAHLDPHACRYFADCWEVCHVNSNGVLPSIPSMGDSSNAPPDAFSGMAARLASQYADQIAQWQGQQQRQRQEQQQRYEPARHGDADREVGV